MASTIVFRRGNTFPSQGSGITLAEPVFNTSQNTFHIGLGHGVTAEWVGAPITGLSASIASGEAYKIPTAAAVKNYVTDYVTAVNGVLTVNGFAGGVTLSAGTGVSVAASSGSITITNTGVQSFNGTTGAVQGVRFVNGKTGDIVFLGGTNIGINTSGVIVTVNNEGVLSVDGSTGAVNNVARTNTANTFTQLQTFSNASGISASQVITKTVQLPGNQSNLTITGALFSDSAGIRLFSTDGLGGDYHTTVKGSVLSADRTITFPNTTGTVALTSQLMGAVNGSTAATTAVTSFNGSTGAVQGVSAAVAGTGISVSGATGAVTITNTGVQSFNGSTGAVQGVSSVNGATGAVTDVAKTNEPTSFSAASNYLTVTDTTSGDSISINPSTNKIVFYDDNSGNEVQLCVTSFGNQLITFPDSTCTLAGRDISQTFTSNNTFTELTNFSSGISAAGGVTLSATLYVGTTAQVGSLDVRSGAAARYMSFVPGPVNQIIARGPSSLNIFHESFNPVHIGDYDAGNNATYIEVDDSNQVIKFYYNGDSYTFPTASGYVGQVLGTTSVGSLSWVNSVQSLNGSTGPVGISAGTGISITQSGTTYTIASTGGGGSKTYERFTPLDNQPPASNFATIDTRNSIMVLDFADSSADESAIFVGVIPEAASLGSGLKVRIIWMATSATSGNVRWGVQFMNLNTDLDSDSFDTATEGNGTANGTNGTPTTTELTVTNIDSLTAGDFFRLKIYREQSDAVNDTMTGDAELIAVEVRSAS